MKIFATEKIEEKSLKRKEKKEKIFATEKTEKIEEKRLKRKRRYLQGKWFGIKEKGGVFFIGEHII